jgi:hypothetical protein
MTDSKHEHTKNISDILESDEFKKDLANAWNAKVTAKEKRLDDLYKYIQTYVNFEDYLNDLEKRKRQEISLKPDEYIDSINEEYDLVEVAFMYGKNYSNEISEKIKSLNIFTSSFVNFKGYIFGSAHNESGKGSYPIWIKEEDVFSKFTELKQSDNKTQIDLF